MSGNAHANRHGHQANCKFCANKPKDARRLKLWRNSTGNRHNPASKRRGKRAKK